jgi:hypothetical protein
MSGSGGSGNSANRSLNPQVQQWLRDRAGRGF